MSEAAKRAAGEAAALLVEDGMRIGLGSGSTMRFAVRAIGARIRGQGVTVMAAATSRDIETLAESCGIALMEPGLHLLDLALDGADEVEVGRGWLLKGLGGALLREKIVAESSRRFAIVADCSKLVSHLGAHAPLPVEVVPFGQFATARRLAALGGAPVLRRDGDGAAFVTDGGNHILDCGGLGPIDDPFTLERRLRAVAGVVATGLFLRPVERVFVGQADGSVRTLCFP